MPIHDWNRVDTGIFHAFHHEWISEITRTLNQGVLPTDYYALPEQYAGGWGPDILALRTAQEGPNEGTTLTIPLTKPKTTYHRQSASEFYRRKQSSIVVRHVSGDRVVAMVEIVSLGNKNHRHAFSAFISKILQLLEQRVHLLLIDIIPFQQSHREGLHQAIWSQIEDEVDFTPPPNKPLELIAYECGVTTDAYLEPLGIGDTLPDMPLFLAPSFYVYVPLEKTYQAAWQSMPLRWKKVIENESGL